MSGRHAGAGAPFALRPFRPSTPPKHRQSGEWKLIVDTPRYRLEENIETHETRTTWALGNDRVGAEL